MQNSKKRYYDELNIFRALIIAWVVIGHSFDADNSFLGFLHAYAYTFHMSAFFILSGFLFTSKVKKESTVKDTLRLCGDRFKRLIVPYLFFTAVSYVLKLFFNDYANNELSSNIFVDVLLGRNNPNGGLWFLYTLFLVSVFALVMSKINTYVMLGASTIAYLIYNLTGPYENIPTPVSSIVNYAIFFYLGMAINKVYPRIADSFENIGKRKAITLSCFSVIMIFFSMLFVYASDGKYPKLTFALTNSLVWYIASQAINASMKHTKKALMVVGNYGMDIYMIGYYVQIAIRVVLSGMLGLPYLLYSMLMMVLGLLLPIPVSKYIVRKFKITRAVMLGDFPKKDK